MKFCMQWENSEHIHHMYVCSFQEHTHRRINVELENNRTCEFYAKKVLLVDAHLLSNRTNRKKRASKRLSRERMFHGTRHRYHD